jgi:hypothetical protein
MQKEKSRGGRRRWHDSPLWRVQCTVSAHVGMYWACLGASSLTNVVRVSSQGGYQGAGESEGYLVDMARLAREGWRG